MEKNCQEFTEESPVTFENEFSSTEDVMMSNIIKIPENKLLIQQESEKSKCLRTKRKRSKIFSDEWVTDDRIKSKKIKKKNTTENSKSEISSDSCGNAGMNDNRIPIVVLERLQIVVSEQIPDFEQDGEIPSQNDYLANTYNENSSDQLEPSPDEYSQLEEIANDRSDEIITSPLQNYESSVTNNEESRLELENKIKGRDCSAFNYLENDKSIENIPVITKIEDSNKDNVTSSKDYVMKSVGQSNIPNEDEAKNYMIIIENEENMQLITNEDIENGKLTVSDDCDISITVGEGPISKIQKLAVGLGEFDEMFSDEKENMLQLQRIMQNGSKYNEELLISDNYLTIGNNSIDENNKQSPIRPYLGEYKNDKIYKPESESTEMLSIAVEKSKTVSLEQVCKRIAMDISSECENDENDYHPDIKNDNVNSFLDVHNDSVSEQNKNITEIPEDQSVNLRSEDASGLFNMKNEVQNQEEVKLKKDDQQSAQGDRIYYFGKCLNCNKVQQRVNGSVSTKCYYCDSHVYSVCLLCRKVFRFSSAFYNHLMADHKEVYKNAKQYITDKLITCKKCGRYFMQRRYLKEHLKVCIVIPEAEADNKIISEINTENKIVTDIVPEMRFVTEAENVPAPITKIETDNTAELVTENVPDTMNDIETKQKLELDNKNESNNQITEELPESDIENVSEKNIQIVPKSETENVPEVTSEFETVGCSIPKFEAKIQMHNTTILKKVDKSKQGEQTYYLGKCFNCGKEQVKTNDSLFEKNFQQKICEDCGSNVYNECSLCHKIFKHSVGIYKHLADEHEKEYNKIVENVSYTILSCDKCSRSFVSGSHLRKHKKLCYAQVEHENMSENKSDDRDSITRNEDIDLERECKQGEKNFFFEKCLKCNKEQKSTIEVLPKNCSDCDSHIYKVCSLCKKVLRYSSSMYNHLRSEHSEEYKEAKKDISKTLFSCKSCGLNFMGMRHFREHERLCDSDYYLKCKFCNYKSKITTYLRNHLSRMHMSLMEGLDMDEIVECATVEATESFLKLHGKESPQEVMSNNHDFRTKNNSQMAKYLKMYCNKCDLAFEKNLKKNILNCYLCSTVLQFQCSRCAARYDSKSSIESHLKTAKCYIELQKNHYKFRCDKCEFVTFNEVRLRRHIFRRHLTPDCLMICRWCDRGFKMANEFKNHERKCKKMKTIFQCDACDYKSDHKGALMMHLKEKHASLQQDLLALEKRVTANESSQGESLINLTNGKAQKSKEFLMNSIRAHCTQCKISNYDAPKRHIRCKSCKKRFIYICKHCLTIRSTYVHCRIHVLRCHMERIYSCKNVGCPCKFSYYGDFSAHVNRCKPGHFFTCSKCDYRTKSKRDLKRHLSRNICKRNCEYVHKKKIHDTKTEKYVLTNETNPEVTNEPDTGTFEANYKTSNVSNTAVNEDEILSFQVTDELVKKSGNGAFKITNKSGESEDGTFNAKNVETHKHDIQMFKVTNKSGQSKSGTSTVNRMTNKLDMRTSGVSIKSVEQSENGAFNVVNRVANEPDMRTFRVIHRIANESEIKTFKINNKTAKESESQITNFNKVSNVPEMKTFKMNSKTVRKQENITFKKIQNIDTIKVNHPPRFYRCDKCDKTFKKTSFLERHYKVCGKVTKPKLDTVIHCDHCTFKTEVKNSMIEHIHTKHAARLFRGINAFKCENCTQVFRNYFIFERHNASCRARISL